MIVSILALTIALESPNQSWTAPLATVAVVCFVSSFGIGFGPIPWLLPAELFAMDKIGQGAAISASSNWCANFLVGQTFPSISTGLGGVCFLPNALILCAFSVFAYFKLPETRGKSMKQILSEL